MSTLNLYKKTPPKRVAFSSILWNLVEMTRIELASESPFTQTSPGAECCLKFPNQADSIQTALSGISLIQRRYGKSSRLSFTTSRRPVRSRGTQRQNGCLIKQRKLIQNCQRLLFLPILQRAGRLYPLFVLQDPRRNLYIPIYFGIKYSGKREYFNYIIIHIFLDFYNSFREKISCSNFEHEIYILSTEKNS